MVDLCNGIVCLLCQHLEGDNVDGTHCLFTLWNLSTGEYRDIPSSHGVNFSLARGFGMCRVLMSMSLLLLL